MTHYDSLIIGAGQNGLTAAAYLARAGQRVLVLERRPTVGGSVSTEALWPGYLVDPVLNRGQLAAEVVRELDLARHGLKPLPQSLSLFAPGPDGSQVWLTPDLPATLHSIGRLSREDAAKWPAFQALLGKVAGFLLEAYGLTMPHLPRPLPAEAPGLAQLGLKLRGLGQKDMMEAVRILPMSLVELLDEWFTSDLLKGALGAQGVHALTQGPMSAGTAYVLLHHWALQNGPFRGAVQGGIGQITQALAAAARAAGAEIRTSAEAEAITVVDGRAAGARLAGGETVAARRVLSSLDPKRTFLGLVGPLALDPSFVHAINCLKMRGSVAKMHLALNGLPRFPAAPGPEALRGTVVIAPSLKYLERAYDAAKYGGLAEQPYLEITVPTVLDPGLAPAGQHVMSIHVQYAAYRGETPAWREAIEAAVLRTLAPYAPDLAGQITHRQVLTPHDLEQAYGLTEGHLYHGEMMLDQFLFMRPVPGWAQYRTPIDQLWLCGPGAHPGGGLSGLPGRNAAREVLKAKAA